MQLRHTTALTSEEYVKQEGWREASLARCPLHRRGGCGIARHGSYRRATPVGMRVARFYCPTGETTFSLLPDCLASRLPGSLDDVEEVVLSVETKRGAGVSIETAAGELRPDIDLPGAVRWVRRRLRPVQAVLLAVVTMWPGRFGQGARLYQVRTVLGVERALVAVREHAGEQLRSLAPPVGLGPRLRPRSRRRRATQHKTGPDPPRANR